MPFDGIQGFQAPTFDDSAWSTGVAGFGNNLGCPLTAQTFWPGNDDLLLRRQFTLPLGATNLRVSVAIDNDIQLFLNGTDISRGLIDHGGCATRDSFVFTAPDSVLLPGATNLLAVRARDTGDVSYVDLEVLVDTP
ncbi:MAG: hypothetical protein JO352_37870 [Chloroflexi bacterium]|nr:hypothetical protein [Chloroflexota bacterium]MBV9598485.1 hypothetical protein [Chloroflexota bacterium]